MRINQDGSLTKDEACAPTYIHYYSDLEQDITEP